MFNTSNAVLTIDLKAVQDNYCLFQNLVGKDSSVAGIIKANAYGVGMKEIVESLLPLGCSQFFVATLEEAIAFRTINTDKSIAVLSGLLKGVEKEYAHYSISPVLNSLDDITRYVQMEEKTKPAALLHIDTGMNRLGLSAEEVEILVNNQLMLQAINPAYIISHFACADEAQHPLTKLQAEKFTKLFPYFSNSKKSLANSSGIFRSSHYHYNMVRPGYALYGGNPTPETNNPVKSVVSLHARILQIRSCKKGESIGYSATHHFTQDTKTATIALGYADGFLRLASGKAIVYYKGIPCPVLGRVSMDLVTIGIGHIHNVPPQVGDSIEILGPHQSVDDLANSIGTIGYEVLTSLGNRYRRVYIS